MCSIPGGVQFWNPAVTMASIIQSNGCSIATRYVRSAIEPFNELWHQFCKFQGMRKSVMGRCLRVERLVCNPILFVKLSWPQISAMNIILLGV
jgi:hypothetical protein